MDTFVLAGVSLSYGLQSGSRTVAAAKMDHFVIIVNGWKSLTIITKGSILDVAAVLDLPLTCFIF